MKKRLILSAVAASVSLTALGGTAYADLRPADEASPVIEISKADKTGDVRVERDAAKVPARIKRSVALSKVDYKVDRTAQTLTVTYPLQRVLTNDRYRQFAITMIATDRDHLERSQVVLVMSGAHKSRVVAFDLDSEYAGERCAGGSSVTDTVADTITQTVPFSCLGGLDHGSLRSFVGVESRKGRDIAWDTTRFTRDVPLTAYVAPPTDPAPTDPAPTDPDPVDAAPADFAPFN